MKHEGPDVTALGAPLSPGRPRLTRVCAIRADIATPTEFDTAGGHGRALFPITGGEAIGRGWTARVLPGGADCARRLPDGTYEVDARYVMAFDDGTMAMVHNAGRMTPQPDGSYHGRTKAELDITTGPHAALGDMVLFGTAFAPADDPDHVFIELWHAEL